MMLTADQIKKLYKTLEDYPQCCYVVIREQSNASSIGTTVIAEFKDQGNIFRNVSPQSIGFKDITDEALW